MPRPRLPPQSSRLLLAALLLASSPDGLVRTGSPPEVDAGALAARAAPILAAPPDASPTARPDAFPACVPLAIVDDSVLAPGGGDAAALARMSRCDALTELRIVDLDLPPALTAAPLNLDLTPLMNLASLKVLMLGDCRCRGWDALARHPGLHELAVGDLFAPADVAALGRITGLERLVLGGRVPGGIAPLGQLVGLSSLILHDRQITDLTALAGLRSLRELALFDLPVADFAPIAQLELEHLEVHGAPLTALSDLPLPCTEDLEAPADRRGGPRRPRPLPEAALARPRRRAGHRRGSIVVTSNRGPDEWLATFADPVRAQAAVDRFTSNAYDLVIDGESYRARQKPTLSRSPKTGSRRAA